MNFTAIIWLVLMLIFLVVEAACAIHLVSIWFALGALAAMAAALLSAPLWLQVVLFLAVSGALLALLWPLTRKFLNPKVTATNIDSVIGSTGIVTEAIDNVAAEGRVKLGAMYWTARSTSGAPIPQGTVVKVDRIEGVKVYVTAAEVPAAV